MSLDVRSAILTTAISYSATSPDVCSAIPTPLDIALCQDFRHPNTPCRYFWKPTCTMPYRRRFGFPPIFVILQIVRTGWYTRRFPLKLFTSGPSKKTNSTFWLQSLRYVWLLSAGSSSIPIRFVPNRICIAATLFSSSVQLSLLMITVLVVNPSPPTTVILAYWNGAMYCSLFPRLFRSARRIFLGQYSSQAPYRNLPRFKT